MSLTLRQLEVFLAAAQDSNFRRTADRLGVSQPTVSGRIRSLEAYLGYDLFDRSSGTSPRLTLEGRSFVTKARELTSRLQLAADRSADDAAPLRLQTLIGPLLLEQRVMPALPTFCYDNPGIDADFAALGMTTDGKELIRSGKVDIYLFTGESPIEHSRDVHVEELASIPCSIYAAPELAARIEHTPEGISAAPFILPPDHHRSGSWIRGRLAAVGIEPRNIVARPQFPDLTMRMLGEGRGLAVFFDEFIDARLQRIGPALAPASRVMMTGPRARQPGAAPLLEFLRRVGALQVTPWR